MPTMRPSSAMTPLVVWPSPLSSGASSAESDDVFFFLQPALNSECVSETTPVPNTPSKRTRVDRHNGFTGRVCLKAVQAIPDASPSAPTTIHPPENHVRPAYVASGMVRTQESSSTHSVSAYSDIRLITRQRIPMMIMTTPRIVIAPLFAGGM